jgi:hypothetical protein
MLQLGGEVLHLPSDVVQQDLANTRYIYLILHSTWSCYFTIVLVSLLHWSLFSSLVVASTRVFGGMDYMLDVALKVDLGWFWSGGLLWIEELCGSSFGVSLPFFSFADTIFEVIYLVLCISLGRLVDVERNPEELFRGKEYRFFIFDLWEGNNN